MANFTPINPDSAGSYNGQGRKSVVIDSTYGTLGGTYGTIDYGYGGFVIKFGGQSSSVGAFPSGAGTSSTPFTPQSTSTGSFVPNAA